MTVRSERRVAEADAARDEAPTRAPASLVETVQRLGRDVAAADYPLEIEGVEAVRASRRRLLDQLADHLLPRLEELSAPAIVVVAGSTGAGKSTLVNSVLGAEVSQAGVLRPTTREPVLAHHPDDAALLGEHPILEAVRQVEHAAVPRGVAILDAPDIDSVLASNRQVARRLLEAADLWLFVTTAARYGDALAWGVLDDAAARGASVAMVLNRVPSDALSDVRSDLLGRLRARGMQGVPLFVVPDVGPHEGLLPAATVAPIGRWLAILAGADRARAVIARTLRGSLAALRPWIDELADALELQSETAQDLRAQLDAALVAPAATARSRVLAGSVATGPVQGRWRELTAAGGALSNVLRRGRVRGSAKTGRARDAAVGPLLADLEHSARDAFASAGVLAEQGLRAHLVALGAVGEGVVDRWRGQDDADQPSPARARAAARSELAATAAAAWVASAPVAVDEALRTADRRTSARARRASTALGRDGLAAVVLAAAAGIAAAGELVDDALGPLRTVVDGVRATLLARVDEVVAAEGAALGALLDLPEGATDATALRLRLAVLKGLT